MFSWPVLCPDALGSSCCLLTRPSQQTFSSSDFRHDAVLHSIVMRAHSMLTYCAGSAFAQKVTSKPDLLCKAPRTHTAATFPHPLWIPCTPAYERRHSSSKRACGGAQTAREILVRDLT